MTMTNGGDQTAQLTVLGTGRLPQPEGGPSVSLLEVFPNRFPHRPYVVSMAFPEYTSLCPVTGQCMSSAWRFPNTRPCAP